VNSAASGLFSSFPDAMVGLRSPPKAEGAVCKPEALLNAAHLKLLVHPAKSNLQKRVA
jgi:hypothetical protein